MPIENEIKFVISDELEESALSDWERIPIIQAYLDDGPRIRRFGDQYVFTHKRWLKDQSAQIEIETFIEKSDFQKLYEQCEISLKKTRYAKQCAQESWVIDYFKDKGDQTYFILAEAELAEGKLRAENIPSLIKPYIQYEAQRGDDDYSSRALADTAHAKRLLKTHS